MKKLVERLHILNRSGRVTVANLPPEMLARSPDAAPEATEAIEATATGPCSLGASLDDAGLTALRAALAAEDGNLTRVARRLGISRPTLCRKLDHYGIRRRFQ